MKPISTILVLAPHTDDGGFGCGATISRYTAEGARVIYAAFSAAKEAVAPHMAPDINRRQVRDATAVLGVRDEDCLVFDFEVRRFPEARQLILDRMIHLARLYDPDIVFLPSASDTHQDHQTIAQEGFRAFKRRTMLGYEMPSNNLDFRTSCFMSVDQIHLEAKIQAASMYTSRQEKPYASPEFMRSLARVRGAQIGREYAESFEVTRWIIG